MNRARAYPGEYIVSDRFMDAFSKLSTKDCIMAVALERIASGEEANPRALAVEALHLAKHCKDKGFSPYFKFQRAKKIDADDLLP